MNADHHSYNRDAEPNVDTPDDSYKSRLLFMVLLTAARNCLASMPNKLEKNPLKAKAKAWFVREIDRSWPTKLDSVCVEQPHDRARAALIFCQFPAGR